MAPGAVVNGQPLAWINGQWYMWNNGQWQVSVAGGSRVAAEATLGTELGTISSAEAVRPAPNAPINDWARYAIAMAKHNPHLRRPQPAAATQLF